MIQVRRESSGRRSSSCLFNIKCNVNVILLYLSLTCLSQINVTGGAYIWMHILHNPIPNEAVSPPPPPPPMVADEGRVNCSHSFAHLRPRAGDSRSSEDTYSFHTSKYESIASSATAAAQSSQVSAEASALPLIDSKSAASSLDQVTSHRDTSSQVNSSSSSSSPSSSSSSSGSLVLPPSSVSNGQAVASTRREKKKRKKKERKSKDKSTNATRRPVSV